MEGSKISAAKNEPVMDGGPATLIPDESQPSEFSINPEAAVMDAAAVAVKLVKRRATAVTMA